MEQQEKSLPRLNTFKIPPKRHLFYIVHSYYFKNLKKVMDEHIKEGFRVFDIGCGNKPFEQYIRTLIKRDEPEYYVGCDIAQSSEQKVDIICDAANISVKESVYDVVICTEVVEHVFEHRKVFEEAYGLLRPGGVFIVSAPFVWDIHEAPYDFYRFTRYGFQRLLSETGFEIVGELPCGGKWATVGQVMLLAIQGKKDAKKSWFVARIMLAIIRYFCNCLFSSLDNLFKDYSQFTINNIFVGKK